MRKAILIAVIAALVIAGIAYFSKRTAVAPTMPVPMETDAPPETAPSPATTTAAVSAEWDDHLDAALEDLNGLE